MNGSNHEMSARLVRESLESVKIGKGLAILGCGTGGIFPAHGEEMHLGASVQELY